MPALVHECRLWQNFLGISEMNLKRRNAIAWLPCRLGTFSSLMQSSAWDNMQQEYVVNLSMGSHYSLVLSELILKTWDTGLTVALGRQHVVVRTCFSTLLS